MVEFLCEANEEPEYNHEVTAITEESDGTVTEAVSENRMLMSILPMQDVLLLNQSVRQQDNYSVVFQ